MLHSKLQYDRILSPEFWTTSTSILFCTYIWNYNINTKNEFSTGIESSHSCASWDKEIRGDGDQVNSTTVYKQQRRSDLL